MLANLFKPPAPVNTAFTFGSQVHGFPSQASAPQNTASYATVSNPNETTRSKRPNDGSSESSQAKKNPRPTQNHSKPAPKLLKQFNSYDESAPNTDIPNDDGFQATRRDANKLRQREKRQLAAANNYIAKLGTGTASTKLTVVPRLQRIFIARLANSTTTDQLKEFLAETLYTDKSSGQKVTFNSYNHTQVILPNNRHSGFTFEVEFSKRDMVDQPDMWPSGAYVAISHPPKRLAATNLSAQSSSSSNATATQP